MDLQRVILKRTLAAIVVAATIFWQPRLPALTQNVTPARLSSLEIDLWPEFDRPELLVIFQGRLADDVALPTRLTLTLPQKVGEPHAVAWIDQDGNRLQAAYDVQTVGEELKVAYTSLQGRAFQFEYYIDALRVEGQRRQFTFRYRLDVSTDDLTVELQQPAGATNIVLTPPAAETYPGFASLTYHLLPLGAMEAGQIVEWQVRYDKSSLQISAEALSEEEGPSSGMAVGGSGAAFGVVAVIGVALAMVLAALWVVGSRRQTETQRLEAQAQGTRLPRPKKRKDRKGTRPRLKSVPPAQTYPSRPAQPAGMANPAALPATSYPPGGYCHQCGTLLPEDALFCHRCGSQRKEA